MWDLFGIRVLSFGFEFWDLGFGIYDPLMPLFEYHCQTCSHDFEVLVRASEKPHCPSCHGDSLEKRLSVFAAHSNGSSRGMSAPAPCGACGDPRGPGACSIN